MNGRLRLFRRSAPAVASYALVVRHKYSPARPESPFGILKSSNCNGSVNALSMRALRLPHAQSAYRSAVTVNN